MGWLTLMEGEVSNYSEYYPKDEGKSFDCFNNATNRLTVVARGSLIDLYSNGTFMDKQTSPRV